MAADVETRTRTGCAPWRRALPTSTQAAVHGVGDVEFLQP
ncbi:hypothetical protein C791_8042 [Amycolatopsis azurea DSM 43854]|uniref:Uncharacterized protein n=1 Tax=Amycolatopsis azurea DSM 43854 TaxID=1238180 RepID=M2PEC0_9PSEU|nr:hypothetical protein C791_8042 [Amycolatopsis azurea DSM 43854]